MQNTQNTIQTSEIYNSTAISQHVEGIIYICGGQIENTFGTFDEIEILHHHVGTVFYIHNIKYKFGLKVLQQQIIA